MFREVVKRHGFIHHNGVATVHLQFHESFADLIEVCHCGALDSRGENGASGADLRADSFAFHVFERFVFIGVFRLNYHDETDIVVWVSKEHLFLTFGRDGDRGGTDIHHIALKRRD